MIIAHCVLLCTVWGCEQRRALCRRVGLSRCAAAHVCPHALLLLLLPLPWRTQVCYALSQLAAGFQDGEGPSSPLSPYYKDIVQALLETVRGAGCSVPWPFPRAIWATGQLPRAHDSFRRPFGEPPLAVLGPAARARAR